MVKVINHVYGIYTHRGHVFRLHEPVELSDEEFQACMENANFAMYTKMPSGQNFEVIKNVKKASNEAAAKSKGNSKKKSAKQADS